jgi:hypothetical protein
LHFLSVLGVLELPQAASDLGVLITMKLVVAFPSTHETGPRTLRSAVRAQEVVYLVHLIDGGQNPESENQSESN